MTRCRVMVAVEALALLGIVVWALARPVTAARGRDEIDFRHLQPFPLTAQQTVTQDVPLQQDQLSGIAIPYQLTGRLPAQIRVLVADQSGLALVQLVHQLEPSKPLEFDTVQVEGRRAGGSVTVTIQRVDDLGGQLTLGAFPTDTTDRPSMRQQPDTTLALQTLYGAWGPAVLKAQLYADRVASLAPPWLPLPVDLVLVTLFLILGLALLLLIGIDRGDLEGSPIMARELAPTDAIPDRDRDPRLS
jgi:hypothetical protein